MYKAVFIITVISLLFNILLIFFISARTKNSSLDSSTNQMMYPYLSKRIFAENQNDILINFVNLRNKLKNYYESINNPDVGIYFEYLPSGVSIGINEKENYILASLLKVPLVMAVYKQIENGRLKEDTLLKVEKKNIDPYYGSLWKKGEGTILTVDQAIQYTLIQSDNTAKSILFTTLPKGSLEDVFDALDIPKDFENLPVVSPKNYSSVLRSLYLSSYLKKEFSEKMLDYLTKSSFNDKLRAGIPKNIPVAHKIGVANDTTNPSKSVYTDCGIIYLPKRPYILCLMSRSTEQEAQIYMKSISKIIYNYVSSTNL